MKEEGRIKKGKATKRLKEELRRKNGATGRSDIEGSEPDWH
jgi:hypothetical protein